MVFWLPLWSFYNIAPRYIDKYIDMAGLYEWIKTIFGGGFAGLFSTQNEK
jgi:hypothetical protein